MNHDAIHDEFDYLNADEFFDFAMDRMADAKAQPSPRIVAMASNLLIGRYHVPVAEVAQVLEILWSLIALDFYQVTPP